MHLFIYFVILGMGLFHLFPSSSADESICDVIVSQQKTVSARETRTQIVATYERCWWFLKCTTYRSIIAYRRTQRQVTQYVISRECCKGYVLDNRRQCILIKGESLPNGTSSNSSRRIPETALPSTTEILSSGNPSPSLIAPRNRTGRGDTDSFNTTPRGAVIMISIILFFVTVIVLSIILGCVVYRRRKKQRNKSRIDNLHMEPLRDLELLSETSSHDQHFSPPTPNDEYAIMEKKIGDPTPAADSLQSSENTCIGGRSRANDSGSESTTKPLINNLGKDQIQGETNRLTHTHMEGSVCLETDEKTGTPVSMNKVLDNCYNEIPVCKGTSDECYTEVNDIPASSVCPEGGAQEYDYCYSKFDNSSPSANECYEEVDNMPPSCVSREGVPQEENEAIGDVQLTYDHLDRGSTPERSAYRETSCKESDSSGKYGVLVQSSSVNSPGNYDTFQRSMSETDQSGIDGYEPLLAVPSPGSKTPEMVDADAYDGLDRAIPKTRRKGTEILHKLQQSTDTTAYGHLWSSFVSDISEECPEKISEGKPIYPNQGVCVTGRESTYIDMSRGRPNSVLIRSGSQQETVPVYTEMAPVYISNNYCNVDLQP